MRTLFRVGCGLAVGLMLAVAIPGGKVLAAEPPTAAAEVGPGIHSVELFDGIEQGRIEVTVVPKGASFCRLLIVCKADRPLNVAVPEAFAAIPVVVQVTAQAPSDPPPAEDLAPGDDPAAEDDLSPSPGVDLPPEDDFPPPPKEPQPLGVGGASDVRLASGSFELTPGEVVQLRLRCVCLDRGKSGPGPEFQYVVRPLSEVTGVLGIYEICRMLGRGELSHRAAQAAAWHLANRLSWKELGAEPRRRYPGMGTRGAFTGEELLEAKRAVEKAVHRSLNQLSMLH